MKLFQLVICLLIVKMLHCQAGDSTSEIIPGMPVCGIFYVNIIRSIKLEGKYLAAEKRFVPKDKSYRAGNFVQGVATVSKAGKFGFIDTSGYIIRSISMDLKLLPSRSGKPTIGTLDFYPQNDGPHHTSMCSGGFRGAYFICDTLGNIRVPSMLAYAHPGYTPESDSDYVYYTCYDPASTSPGCEACGECYGTLGIISTTGTLIVPPNRYLRVSPFHNGFSVVTRNHYTYGFIDTTGQEITPCKFESAGAFNDGLAPVRIDKAYGYINTSGVLQIPALYREARAFENGKAKVIDGSGVFYIDTAGNRIE